MITCVAIDDEPIALEIIKDHCQRYGDMELACFTSPVEGMDYIARTRPDLVFLDIEMKSHNGIELAKELPAGTTLIFTTAFSEYALDGFNLNAIDFLHKPIFYPRFTQAMEKAKTWIAGEKEMPSPSPATINAITLKADHKNVVISLDTISHIEAMDNYVKVYRKDLPTVVSQITMKEVEGMLPADRFIRVHRSFIVPLGMVDRFSNRKIFIHDVAVPIPVGRTYNEAFLSRYNIFKQSSLQQP